MFGTDLQIRGHSRMPFRAPGGIGQGVEVQVDGVRKPSEGGVVLGLVLVLSLLTVLPVRFVYPNRPPCWRGFFLGGALAWMVLVLYMLLRQPSDSLDWAVWVSFIYPVLYVISSFYLDWKIPPEVSGEAQS